MNLVREKRIKEEEEERTGLDLIYKEKIVQAEQEKLAQLAITTKLEEEEKRLKEEEERRLKESQEQEEIIKPEEEKDEEKEENKKED